MATVLPAGPYRSVTLDNGDSAPFYVLPFDKRGVCEAPKTRAQLIDSLAQGRYTDVFLFSHGWNNDWTVATKRYDDFLRGFLQMRAQFKLTAAAGYRPLLVGIFWPSTALTFGEAEEGPAMAGAPDDDAVARERHDIAELGARLAPADAARFFDLAQRDAITEEQARELGAMFAPLGGGRDGELPDTAPTAADLVDALFAVSESDGALDDFGTATPTRRGEAQIAGVIDIVKTLDPRQLIRGFTVWQMKDRAGTVGASGVAPLLNDLLAKSAARLHLVGHSFGAKVMMSAVCVAPLPRNIRSALLLQPAISHLCFAETVEDTGRPGGYRQALARVDGRILTTFSSHDQPLTKLFHLAFRRASDLGEAQIAAAGEPPSPYAALGGFGPRGAGEKILDINDPPQPYVWPARTKLIGLKGDRTISGHGDISNPSTWWALYSGAFAQ
jgi:hypothetical protein